MSTTTQRGRPPSTETRIRRQYAELLEDIGGGRIDYGPDELAMIDAAVAIAKRIDLLAAALDAAAAGANVACHECGGKPGADPAVLVRISAEMRASEKESVLMFGRVRRGLEKTIAADKPADVRLRVAGHNGGRR